jgi:hypothetical protein
MPNSLTSLTNTASIRKLLGRSVGVSDLTIELSEIEEAEQFQTATYVGPGGGTTTVSDHGFRALPNDPYVKLSHDCP